MEANLPGQIQQYFKWGEGGPHRFLIICDYETFYYTKLHETTRNKSEHFRKGGNVPHKAQHITLINNSTVS